MKSFFKYSGSKANKCYIEIINDLIKDDNSTTYVEPFVGSGGVLFNLDKKFDNYIINDIDTNIIRIYKTFKEINYKFYFNEKNKIISKFGKFNSNKKDEVEECKKSYYTFRNWFNKNHWLNDSVLEGVYLHILANTCINSFLRFGPNGMNQSFGNRDYSLNEDDFNYVHDILQKTDINCKNYVDIYNDYPNTIFFLDPPYFSQKSSYIGFNVQQYNEFIELLKNKKYIYTDIYNDYNCKIKNKIFIRQMRNTCPSSLKEIRPDKAEYIFYNLE